jgi:hypothetical protein
MKPSGTPSGISAPVPAMAKEESNLTGMPEADKPTPEGQRN